MSETFIADMRHFTELADPSQEVPGPAVRMRRFLGRNVEAATLATPGKLVQTELRCRRRPAHKPCPGPLQIMLTHVPQQIRWLCPSCGDNGIIIHWTGTPWDLTPRKRLPHGHKGSPEILLTGIEHRALQRMEILDDVSREIVNRGRTTTDGIVLKASEEELEDLAGFVAAEVNHEKRNSRRAMLRGILGRLQLELDSFGNSHRR